MKEDFSLVLSPEVGLLDHKVLGGSLGGSDGKESTWSVGDMGSIPGWGRSPGGGHGNPLQSSCLENPTDGGAWRAAVHGVAKVQAELSDFRFHSAF